MTFLIRTKIKFDNVIEIKTYVTNKKYKIKFENVVGNSCIVWISTDIYICNYCV